MTRHLVVWMVLALLLGLLPACGGSEAEPEPEDLSGRLGEACRSNGSCNEGLICVDNICRFPPTEDGDVDVDVDGDADNEPDIELECVRDTQCPPDHICEKNKCVEVIVDGDADSDADGDSDSDSDTLPDGPILSLFPPTLDFGAVAVDAESVRTLTFQNVGNALLTIASVTVVEGESDQGVFELTAPVNEFSLPAGDSLVISTRFSRDAEGAAEAVLRIESDSVIAATIDIPMVSEATGRVNLALDPEDLNFGAVPLGQQGNLALTLKNDLLGDDVADLTIQGVEIVDADASAFFVGGGVPTFPKVLGPGNETVIPLAVSPDDSGELEGTLRIFHTDPSKAYPLDVPLYALGVVPVLETDPSTVEFGPVSVGDTRTVLLTLRNHGGDTVRVESATFSELSSDAFSIALNTGEGSLTELPAEIPVGESATISMIFAPQAFGQHEATLYIRSNNYVNDTTTVGLTGTAIPPELSITPGAIEFSCIQVGQDDTRPLTIDFQGEGEVTIQNVFVQTGYVYAVTNAPQFPVTLTTGDNMQVDVTFTPNAPSASEDDTLVIVIGDEDTISYNVSLIGCATAAEIGVSWDESGAFVDVQKLPEGLPVIDEMSPEQLALWVERAPVVLTNEGTAPLHISQIYALAEDSEIWSVDALAPVTVAPGESSNMEVLFAPRVVTNYLGRIIICSDAIDALGNAELCDTEGHKPVEISISRRPLEYVMFVEPIGGLVNFGQPEPGEFVTAQVIIQNMRPTTMHIDSIELVGSEAALQAYFIDAITPAPGEDGWDLYGGVTDNITVDLRFQPPGGGALAAALAITHNDKDASKLGDPAGSAYPVWSVTLSGNGTENTPPVAIVKSPAGEPDGTIGTRERSTTPEQVIFLDSADSYDPEEGDGDFIAAWQWSIAEQSGYTWYGDLTSASATISFEQPGDYHISLQLTDSRDAISVPTPDSQLLVHVQLDPIAVAKQLDTDLSEVTAYVRTPLLLNGADSWDPDGEVLAWYWYLREYGSDDEPELFSTESQPSITFDTPGTYDILLTVEDDDGRQSPTQGTMLVVVKANDRVRVEAIWTNGGNVDLHYIRPGGSFGGSGDCNPANPTPNWGGFGNPVFRNESQTGAQPEVIAHDNPGDGVYTVRAQYVDAPDDCGYVPNCQHFEDNCDICGCDCWAPLCYINWDICCKSCDECINEWVCTPKPAQVTFYVYINGSATPTYTVQGMGYTIDESPGSVEFSLHRENGAYIIP